MVNLISLIKAMIDVAAAFSKTSFSELQVKYELFTSIS